MRSESSIRHRLKRALWYHLKRRLQANFKKAPETCTFNTVQELGKEGHVGVCGHLGETQGNVCDVRMDEGEQARMCEAWEPLQTKEEIKTGFAELFEDTDDLGPIAAQYPDVAALLWVLGEGTMPRLEDSGEDPPAMKGWDFARWPWTKDPPRPQPKLKPRPRKQPTTTAQKKTRKKGGAP